MGIDYSKLSELSDEEIEAAIIDCSNDKEAIKEQARVLTAEWDRRCALAQAATMSDTEKANLVQVIQAEGIVSQEAVNGG